MKRIRCAFVYASRRRCSNTATVGHQCDMHAPPRTYEVDGFTVGPAPLDPFPHGTDGLAAVDDDWPLDAARVRTIGTDHA